MDDRLAPWLWRECQVSLHSAQPLSGGSINEVFRITTKSGERLILKLNPNATKGFFLAEQRGLSALASAGIKVPAVVAVSEHMLLLEDLGESTASSAFWPSLAQLLATLHQTISTRFGFTDNNFIGPTPQDNRWMESGIRFFAERRLLFQTSRAYDAGLLTADDCRKLNLIAERLADWIPEQPPVLLHGDLWRGNIHCTGSSKPALIDPACYYGWAEAELAMTTLFGELPEAFYREYQEISGMVSDWRSRATLYNLYHLLNHLNLFGGSYLSSIRAVLKRYVK